MNGRQAHEAPPLHQTTVARYHLKVRGNPFRYVGMRNSDIARHGAANAIRQRAARALQMGFHHTARHQNAIADILDGVTT